MKGSIGIIGGTDGPTAIFITTSSALFGWINTWGLGIIILLLIPNIIYAFKKKEQRQAKVNKVISILEQIGRYGTMILMVCPIGKIATGYSFSSFTSFVVYFLGNIGLILSYWIVWVIYFKTSKPIAALLLAVIPTVIFLLSAVTLSDLLLMVFAILFGTTHIYITYQNTYKA